MPIAGIGLHVIFAALCAIHVVRSRQPLYWLFILFAFPMIGSLVYFFAVYLPDSRLQRGAMRAVSAAARAIDPTRELREARSAFEDTPNTDNRMRLAAALLELGDAAAAVDHYRACLAGPLASDPDIMLSLARALVESQRYPEALDSLERLRRVQPDFRCEAVSLLIARSLAGNARNAEARQEFESAMARFGTYEAKAEYAIWAWAVGDRSTAEQLDVDLDRISSRWNALTRSLNEPVQRRLLAARQLANRRS